MDVEQRARELLASVAREMYPDDIAERYVIDKLLADELDLISARAAVRAIIAALTPPEGYLLVPVEPTSEMVKAGLNAPFCGHPETGGPSLTVMWAAMLTARPEVKP